MRSLGILVLMKSTHSPKKCSAEIQTLPIGLRNIHRTHRHEGDKKAPSYEVGQPRDTHSTVATCRDLRMNGSTHVDKIDSYESSLYLRKVLEGLNLSFS